MRRLLYINPMHIPTSPALLIWTPHIRYSSSAEKHLLVEQQKLCSGQGALQFEWCLARVTEQNGTLGPSHYLLLLGPCLAMLCWSHCQVSYYEGSVRMYYIRTFWDHFYSFPFFYHETHAQNPFPCILYIHYVQVYNTRAACHATVCMFVTVYRKPFGAKTCTLLNHSTKWDLYYKILFYCMFVGLCIALTWVILIEVLTLTLKDYIPIIVTSELTILQEFL